MDTSVDFRIPVTILTGFLGAGKTTLLNRILTAQHGRRIAVIENEYGEIGIDNDLVINTDEEIFEMNNGCICCTVRGDLIRILGNLMKRRNRFDYIVVETTGLADPAPVAQTFFMDEDMKENFRLDAIITVVDALHVWQHIDTSDECQEQIAFADVLLLNKIDLVQPEDVERLEKRVREMNPACKIHRTRHAEIDIGAILDVHAFDLAARSIEDVHVEEEEEHHHHHHHHHHHDDAVGSVGLTTDEPLDVEAFNAWMSELLREKGPDIFRAKGILNFAGTDRRFVFQGIHMLFDGQLDRPWKENEPRQSRIVFIGRNLDREALTNGFLGCV